MKTRRQNFILALAALYGAVSLAQSSIARAELAMDCPLSIAVTQQVNGAAPGWRAIDAQSETRLARVAFYLGHPSERGSLVPDTTRRLRGEERVTWTFPRKAGDEFWLACAYSDTRGDVKHISCGQK